MTKTAILNHLGVIVRPVTRRDTETAQTDFQRHARFVATLPNGHEYYMASDSISEILATVRINFHYNSK